VTSIDSVPGRRLAEAVRRIAAETRDRQPIGVDHDHADDGLGTIASDDAIGFDPVPLLRTLDRCGAEVVIMGQVAGIMHGSTELTGDLDLLWSGSPDETSAMAAAFADVGAELWDDDDRPVPCAPASFALPKVVFRSSHASGDCCTPALPWRGLDVDGMIERADQTTLDGIELRFLAVADLIEMRSIVGRPKDIRRVDELRRLHPDLD
jgi:hypothetical protein